MLKHNLIDVFKSFSPHEVKKFEDFLLSPYFNTSKKMYKIYLEIIKYYPAFDNELCNKKSLSIITSSKGVYNDSTLRDALSNLLKLALRFLGIYRIEREETNFENYILYELFDRNLYKPLEKKIYNRNKSTKFDSFQLYNKYLFKTLAFNYDYTRNKVLNKADAIKKIQNILSLSFDLFNFYETEMVCLMMNLLTLSNKFDIHLPDNALLKIDFLNEFIHGIHNFPKEDPLILYIYRALIVCFKNFEEDKFYYEYKGIVMGNKDKLSPDEISFHIDWMINYCLQKKKEANSAYNFEMELFSLYNMTIDNGFYKNRKTKYLSADLFRDIIIQGLELKKYSWVFSFIANFQKELLPIDRDNLCNFGYSYYYFTVKDIKNALNHYKKIKVDTFIYKYDLKTLVMKTYFDLNYLEEALVEIKSYREFLRTNTLVSKERKLRTRNFLKILEELILGKLGKPRFDINYLESQISKNSSMIQRKWILEKIIEFKKK